MAKVIHEHKYPTLEAIDIEMEAAQERSFRPYLGMSAIGFPCERRIWLDFRFTALPFFKAATLRKFEDGHTSEAVMAARLQMLTGITLFTTAPDGKQIGFCDVRGHVKGHIDGMIMGILEAPNSWHVWEHKACEDTKKNKLEKLVNECEETALEKWDAQYFAQAQYYMRTAKIKRHFLTVSSPGCRTAISVRTHYDAAKAADIAARAERLVKAPVPPERIASDREHFLCKYSCGNADVCFGTQAPIVSCRSCVHSEAVADGNWRCTYTGKYLTLNDQYVACKDHLYIPDLLDTWAMVADADLEENTITYNNKLNGKLFTNGRWNREYTSWEIYMCQDKQIIGDPDVTLAKETTGARLHE